MQDNQQTLNPSEDEQYREFKRIKRIEEAKASVLKIECDCLAPTVDRAYLKEICRDANTVELGSIVVFPAHVKSCVSFLGKDPKVSLIAAISYPCGADATEIKVAAVKRAVKDGVDEAEVSAPVSYIKDGNWGYVKREFKKVKKAGKNRAAVPALPTFIFADFFVSFPPQPVIFTVVLSTLAHMPKSFKQFKKVRQSSENCAP